ncbi:pur operon repressor [Thermobrachium celere]|uniref:pur operon repressor n=1 Tax=Thermobrachium celere TaxID=53422 RepID=UPI0005938791|nr:pur operon repressor [Thermobrachium celere]GFR35163.1 pur operon repressor [Thermobrachium celere]
MDRLQRKERVAAIIKILSDNPNKVFSLGYFSEFFGSARSTLSEDIVLAKKVVEYLGCGKIETISGAAGGVKYIPGLSDINKDAFLKELCVTLSSPDRIIKGGYIYMNDIVFSPEISSKVGLILASYFIEKNVDYVITVETKGIPIALMTARALNKPLVIARREVGVTEGSSVSINYVTGSSKKIQRMSLGKRAITKGSRCIFIDDFMKAGGTANGIIELLKEFECELVGIGVLVEGASDKKLVSDYISLLTLETVDEENGIIKIYPTKND